jgi:hypothetical protein
MRARRVTLGFLLAIGGLIIAMEARPAEAGVLITIDKSTQRMTVSLNGETLWHWPVSTGRPGYDTPSGTFHAFRMEADHFSKEWDDAPMPHSIFFTKIGHAIHGYLDTRHIGSPASHGCVRLNPENAAKLYALVEKEGVLNTTVVLTGSAEAAIARRGKPHAPAAEETAVTSARPSYGSSYSPQTYGSGYAQQSYGQPYGEQYGPYSYRARPYSNDERYPQPVYREPAYPQPQYPRGGYPYGGLY